MAEDGYRVTLNMYDLSQGLARQFSTTLLGKTIEAIWHTGVVVYGNEYYFGNGIQHDAAGRTIYGTPVRVVDLGLTHVPKEVFEEYLEEIRPRYTAETYNLLRHNCNNFSNEVAQFLVGTSIPDYILQLPNEVLSSPMGALILPMIQNIESTMRTGGVPQAPQLVNPLAAAAAAAAARPSVPMVSASYKNRVRQPASFTDQAKAKAPEPVTDTTKPVAGQGGKEAVAGDPLGDARGRVQEEITKEFAAIMATGTLRASEAAALATRRVMEKHGRMNTPMK